GVAYRLAKKARAAAARRRAAEARAPAARPAAAADAADAAPWGEVRAALHAELARLPGRLRAPLVPCYLGGLAQGETWGRRGCGRSVACCSWPARCWGAPPWRARGRRRRTRPPRPRRRPRRAPGRRRTPGATRCPRGRSPAWGRCGCGTTATPGRSPTPPTA